MNWLHVDVLRTFTLDGTIDGHDPVGVVFRITGGDEPFRLVVVTVNWGRGYAPGEFRANVLRVLDATDERQYVVLLIQELDEDDSAPERKIFMADMEPGTSLVPEPPTPGRETIAVSPEVLVNHRRRVMTMDEGQKIGAPKGTGPRRFFVSCVITINGVKIGLGDQHPHRVDPDWDEHARNVVEQARRRGVSVSSHEVHLLMLESDVSIYGGDMNDTTYPHLVAGEKVAAQRGLDTVRYVVSGKG